MKCEDMDWVAYEANALAPERKREMDEHLSTCNKCKKEWNDHKRTTGVLKQIWSEARRECIATERLIDLREGRVAEQEKRKILFHLETCSGCAESYQMLNEFYEEFDERAETPMLPRALPDSIRSALEQDRKTDLTDRLAKAFSALAGKGADSVRDIRDRAGRIVERMTGPGLAESPMPAIRKDAAEVEEEGADTAAEEKDEEKG